MQGRERHRLFPSFFSPAHSAIRFAAVVDFAPGHGYNFCMNMNLLQQEAHHADS